MSQPPAVSVIMPTYNRPGLLARALDSLARQTYRDFDVVVVNDAGLPVEHVVEAARQHLDVVLVEHEENLGRCGALNSALERARGEWIAFLDDDDVYYPHHLETLVQAGGGRRDVAVYSHAVKVTEDEQGDVVSREIVGARDYDQNLLQVTNYIVGMSVLAPAQHVRGVSGFDTRLRVLEDWDLWLKLSGRVRFEHVPVPTAEYRWRAGKGNQTVREWFRFHSALEQVYRNHPLPHESPLRAMRQQMLTGSAGRSEAYSYEVSIVLECDADLAAAARSIEDYVEVFGDEDVAELVLAVPDMTRWSALVETLDGDFQAFSIGQLTPESVLPFLRGRVGGRRIGHLRAGQDLDRAALARLLAATGGTRDVGVDSRRVQRSSATVSR